MTKHYSEADLLETWYTQPGESMPVMMHLASCSECAARYERLEQKLREATACSTEKPATFWTRQRISIMRRVDVHREHAASLSRTLRVAAAAILAFFLGGVVVYKTVEPELKISRPPVVAVATVNDSKPAIAAPAATPSELHDAWQSDELKDFHAVVQWESWVADTPTKNGASPL